MNKVFTIGFTKISAEKFFSIIKNNEISLLVDVRLNNTSQLAAFSKYPDIVFFLKEICNCDYKHEVLFAPKESTLSLYKKKIIDWNKYVDEFSEAMENRQIKDYIEKNYNNDQDICLLCSEPTPKFCHRRLIAELFLEVFPRKTIVHL